MRIIRRFLGPSKKMVWRLFPGNLRDERMRSNFGDWNSSFRVQAFVWGSRSLEVSIATGKQTRKLLPHPVVPNSYTSIIHLSDTLCQRGAKQCAACRFRLAPLYACFATQRISRRFREPSNTQITPTRNLDPSP